MVEEMWAVFSKGLAKDRGDSSIHGMETWLSAAALQQGPKDYKPSKPHRSILKDKWELVLVFKKYILTLETQDEVLGKLYSRLKGDRREEVKGAWIY